MTPMEFWDRGLVSKLKTQFKGKGKICTKCAYGVKPIGVLNAVQFQTLVMPICPFPGFSEFLLGAPGHIINDAGDHQTSPVCNEIDPMGLGHRFEKRREEGVRICSY